MDTQMFIVAMGILVAVSMDLITVVELIAGHITGVEGVPMFIISILIVAFSLGAAFFISFWSNRRGRY